MAAGIGNVQFLHSVPSLEHNWDDGDDCNKHFSVDEPVSYHLIVASVLLPTVSVLQAPASSL